MATNDFTSLRNGVVLAELGGHGDGPYCAEHGAGGAMVFLGSYIVDAGDNVDYPKPFVFKPGRDSYSGYLKDHVAAARESGAQVAVSVATVETADTLDFLRTAQEAGADYASYCAHSSMEMFVSKGLSSMLCRPDRWEELTRWARAIVESVEIPVIFKIGARGVDEEVLGSVDRLTQAGVPIIHINVWDTREGAEGLDMVSALKGKCELLIAGGGVKDIEDARRVIAAGADAVSLGNAAMKDPHLIGRIQRQLRP